MIKNCANYTKTRRKKPAADFIQRLSASSQEGVYAPEHERGEYDIGCNHDAQYDGGDHFSAFPGSHVDGFGIAQFIVGFSGTHFL